MSLVFSVEQKALQEKWWKMKLMARCEDDVCNKFIQRDQRLETTLEYEYVRLLQMSEELSTHSEPLTFSVLRTFFGFPLWRPPSRSLAVRNHSLTTLSISAFVALRVSRLARTASVHRIIISYWVGKITKLITHCIFCIWPITTIQSQLKNFLFDITIL